MLGEFGFQGEEYVAVICGIFSPSLLSPSLLALQKVMCPRAAVSADLHSGHGSTRCSPRHSRQQSGWGFRIRHLSEQTQTHIFIKSFMAVILNKHLDVLGPKLLQEAQILHRES